MRGKEVNGSGDVKSVSLKDRLTKEFNRNNRI